jgi:hypothetical protein
MVEGGTQCVDNGEGSAGEWEGSHGVRAQLAAMFDQVNSQNQGS